VGLRLKRRSKSIIGTVLSWRLPKKQKDEEDYASALSAMMFDSDQNDNPEALQTIKLISQARTPGNNRFRQNRVSTPTRTLTGFLISRTATDISQKLKSESFDSRYAKKPTSELRISGVALAGFILSALTLIVLVANAYIFKCLELTARRRNPARRAAYVTTQSDAYCLRDRSKRKRKFHLCVSVT
jgi:hypothetical protein